MKSCSLTIFCCIKNSVVIDLINKAGGLNKDANISVTSLAKHLNDEMVVIIYTNEEIEEYTKGNTIIKYVDKECFCPKIENNSCIDKKITNNDEIIISNKVSLNSATKEELMTLKGIGESKANSIINYRETNKGFKDIKEITKVKGIGNNIYEKIKDNITL